MQFSKPWKSWQFKQKWHVTAYKVFPPIFPFERKYRVNCHNFKLKTRRKHKHRKRHKPGCTDFSETVLDNSLIGRK